MHFLEWGNEAVRVETQKLQAIIEMARAMCHELNQPMQSIYGYCELLMMGLEEKYETKDYLKGKIIDIDRATE